MAEIFKVDFCMNTSQKRLHLHATFNYVHQAKQLCPKCKGYFYWNTLRAVEGHKFPNSFYTILS